MRILKQIDYKSFMEKKKGNMHQKHVKKIFLIDLEHQKLCLELNRKDTLIKTI